MLLILLLAPCALCFAVPAVQSHACCSHESAVRTQARKDCCVFAPAPAPVQPATATVVSLDRLAPAADSVGIVHLPVRNVLLASNEPSPDGMLARFPSNLRI